MRWPEYCLGDILSLEYGLSLPARKRKDGGAVPVAGSNGVSGYHCEPLVAGPGIVVGRKGSAGKIVWYESDFWPIDTTYYVVPRTRVDLRWTFYLLQQLKLDRLAIVTGVPGLNRADAYSLRVWLPPLSEQRRIVEILDQADALRRLSAEADAKAQRILTALFLKMFGEGAANSSRWPSQTISQLAEQRRGSIRTGPFGSQLRHAEFISEGVPVLGIDNVVTNRFRWARVDAYR